MLYRVSIRDRALDHAENSAKLLTKLATMRLQAFITSEVGGDPFGIGCDVKGLQICLTDSITGWQDEIPCLHSSIQ